MASLPTMEDGRSAGLSSSLAASVVGLVAGAAITLAVIGGLFGGETAGIAPEVQNSKIAVVDGALNERIGALEKLNSLYVTALDRMNQNQPSSITPPAELGRLLRHGREPSGG